MIKSILFDYGGTLDTAACHWAYVLHDGFKNTGCNFSFDDFRPSYVHAERELAKAPIITPADDFHTLLLKKARIETAHLCLSGVISDADAEVQEQIAQNVAKYCDDFAHRHVMQSAEVLSEVHKRYKLIMVSNFYGNLNTILRTYGIAQFFDSVIESAVVGVRKPNPEIYALGIQAAGCHNEECLVVGDSFSKDIVPAHSLGCQTIWFKGREWEEKNYDETLPTHVITALPELLQWY